MRSGRDHGRRLRIVRPEYIRRLRSAGCFAASRHRFPHTGCQLGLDPSRWSATRKPGLSLLRLQDVVSRNTPDQEIKSEVVPPGTRLTACWADFSGYSVITTCSNDYPVLHWPHACSARPRPT